MLIQAEEGKYFLEDLMTRIPIDLSKAVMTKNQHCCTLHDFIGIGPGGEGGGAAFSFLVSLSISSVKKIG